MTTQRWHQIVEVVSTVLDADPDLRNGLITELCNGDPDLRAEVESLIACDERGEGYLASAVQQEAVQVVDQQNTRVIGSRLGPYRITELIGRGGMGTVYRAMRDDDAFQKCVAVKLIKRGMDTDEVVERFRAERHILARLDHQNIARLLDGGATEEGLPYLVMEYVEGVPLLEYGRSVGLEEKLRLFRQICSAVQYAHQNLVVHRDLKPANILVTAAGVPKLLDFGIAKLLTSESTETVAGTRMLTPDYASPEQVMGMPVTTSADIYSLGTILYELLTGERAHQFTSRATGDIERVICERAPALPSSINRLLRGDIDNIVLMALRKEPERRYATVEQFSEDIRRSMDGLTVSARKDTLIYRTGKLVRRNKLPVAAGLFAWIALATGAGAAWYQMRRAEHAYLEARQYANSIMTSTVERVRQLPGGLAANHDLATKSLDYNLRVSRERPNDPDAQLELALGYFRMSQVYYMIAQPSLLQFEKALQALHQARVIVEGLYHRDPKSPQLVAFMAAIFHFIGSAHLGSGQLEEADQWFQRAVPYVKESDSKMYARVGSSGVKALHPAAMAMLQVARGNFREVLAAVRPGGDIGFSLHVHSHIGMGALDRALLMLRERKRGTGQNYLERSQRRSWDILQSGLEWDLGDHEAAMRLASSADADAQRLLDADRNDPAARMDAGFARRHLAYLLRETDSAKSALLYREVIQTLTRILEKTSGTVSYKRDLIRIHAERARPLRKIGDHNRALRSLQDARKIEDQIGEPQAFTRMELGDLYLAQGERQQALASYQEAIPIAAKAVGAKPQDMWLRYEHADAYERLGAFQEQARDWRGAHESYSAALSIWRDWTKYGVSSVKNELRERRAAAAVTRIQKSLNR